MVKVVEDEKGYRWTIYDDYMLMELPPEGNVIFSGADVVLHNGERMEVSPLAFVGVHRKEQGYMIEIWEDEGRREFDVPNVRIKNLPGWAVVECFE